MSYDVVATAPARAVAAGVLRLASLELDCYVLEDGQRVLSQTALARGFLGRRGGAGNGDFARLVRKFGCGSADFPLAQEVRVRVPRGGTALVVPSKYLVDLCVGLCRAWREGKLHGLQRPTVERAQLLVEALAGVGLEALIDEATGHQNKRTFDYLQARVDAFLRPEAERWRMRFFPSLVRELCRLHGPTYDSGPYPAFLRAAFARLYRMMLGREAYAALRERNPDPRTGPRHHQWLQPEMQTLLERDLRDAETLARVCVAAPEFWHRFAFQLGQGPLQIAMFPAPTRSAKETASCP